MPRSCTTPRGTTAVRLAPAPRDLSNRLLLHRRYCYCYCPPHPGRTATSASTRRDRSRSRPARSRRPFPERSRPWPWGTGRPPPRRHRRTCPGRTRPAGGPSLRTTTCLLLDNRRSRSRYGSLLHFSGDRSEAATSTAVSQSGEQASNGKTNASQETN